MRLPFKIGCLALLIIVSLRAQAQSPSPSPTPEPDDVLRINTDLVQTEVMVFDHKGHFIRGLKPEQFELTVEGKPQPFSFFEEVNAGSSREVRLLSKEKTAGRVNSLMKTAAEQSFSRVGFVAARDCLLW